MLFYSFIGALIAVLTALVNSSQRRLSLGAAAALIISFFALPAGEAVGFLSRQKLEPTSFGLLPLFPLLGLLLITAVLVLLSYRVSSKVHGAFSLVAGFTTLGALFLWTRQQTLIADMLPLYGLMEALTGIGIALVIATLGWGSERLRWPLLIGGIILGLGLGLWLNSGTGKAIFPKTEGYYKLLRPAPEGTEADIVKSFNDGLDALNEQRQGIGLSQLEPLNSLTDLEGQRLPREAADAGYRLVSPKATGYGTPLIYLLAGLLIGSGAMLLGKKQLTAHDDFRSGLILATILTLLVPAFAATDFSLIRLIEGWPFLADFLDRSWPPNPEALKDVAEQMLITIEIALVGTFLATLFALPLSFLASRNLTQGNAFMGTLFVLTRAFFNILRGIDTLILALVFVAAVGLGPFAGVIAMAIHSVAALGKVYSESIENVAKGPIEALEAVGASGTNVVRWAIIPQVAPLLISWTLYRFEINFRVSIVIGLVGAGGIGFFIKEKMGNGQYDDMMVAIIAIILVVNIIDFASSWLRSRLV